MKYKVLKDFEEHKVKKVVGDEFIPAETNFPRDRVNALVLDGTLEAPAKPPEKAKPVETEEVKTPTEPPAV